MVTMVPPTRRLRLTDSALGYEPKEDTAHERGREGEEEQERECQEL